MKKSITIALLLSSFGVMAQSKKQNSTPVQQRQYFDTSHLNDITQTGSEALFITPNLTHYTWISVGNGATYPILTINRYPEAGSKPIESVTIHVKRSNTIWLNDSTLVVKP